MRGRGLFVTVRTEGAILPADLLKDLTAGTGGLEGLDPASYHLSPGEKLNEAVNRSWQRLLPAWHAFREAAGKLGEGDPGIALTRERWLLPLCQELGYGRLQAARALEVGGRSFAVSHLWGNVPIHLVGKGVDLDRRTRGVAGAARESPHSLLQQLLNHSDRHLWGFVSNGVLLRILRDNSSLTRLAYVEFDLEAMFDGEVFPDFVLLWILAHESRVEGEDPQSFWLERWSKEARTRGKRALDQLRGGVEEAIVALGRGFLSHKGNTDLRARLQSGALSKEDYYRALLRLVYRLIFLFVAEDRDLLLDPAASAAVKERWRYYSTARLRDLAGKRRGTRHVDLWQLLRLVMEKLGSDEGSKELGLPPLGSFLWSAKAIAPLAGAGIENAGLLDAVRALAYGTDGGARRPVDFKNLGSQELGSVYESLLELHPEIHADAGVFDLKTASGHERKTTGSYYTPESLIQCLLDSALDPVLDEAARKPGAEKAILALKVCDPACGSGHFLIAAAHRIAKRLAAIRSESEEPPPAELRRALRDVIGHSIYGVDVNEMAVELSKVSLWMEALEPGKPLSFLDRHVVCGNSLLGATPALLDQGIPDAAFEAIEGDNKDFVKELRKATRKFDPRQVEINLASRAVATPEMLASAVASIEAIDDATIAGVRAKEAELESLKASAPYRKIGLIPNAWCAAFVCRKVKEAAEPVTRRVFHTLKEGTAGLVSKDTLAEIDKVAGEYRWLHWHVAFPEVFRLPRKGETPENKETGWSGGFDVVLGNPPWERIKLQEEEWFAARRPDIAAAVNAASRRRMIAALAEEDPPVYKAFLEDRRRAEGESHFLRSSGRFPLCGRGDINTYAVFAETNRQILGATGRVGCIVPSGIATDDTTKFFFQDLMESRTLASLYDFENAVGMFPGVGHGRFKFCLLTISGRGKQVEGGAEFAFFARHTADLDHENRRFVLSAEDVALLNPNTRTCPIFRSRHDAEITKAIYRRVPVLLREEDEAGNPWGVEFVRLFDMANDSGLFRTREQLEAEGYGLEGNVFRKGDEDWLPLYEAKMVHHFDHRFGDYADHPPGAETTQLPDVPAARLADPSYVVQPRYWVPASEVAERLEDRWNRSWLVCCRKVTNSTNERTVIAAILPLVGTGDSMNLVLASHEAESSAFLSSNLSCLAMDFAARQKLGGTNLNYFVVRQLPVLSPSVYQQPCVWSANTATGAWLHPRVLELTYTAWDLAPFARDLDYDGPPFRWDDERRFLLRAELDAAFFHLYGITREDADYILDTFPIVRRHDEAEHGEYRAKRVILEIYDEMQAAIASGKPYQTRLTPPPADPKAAHPAPSPAATVRPAASPRVPDAKGKDR